MRKYTGSVVGCGSGGKLSLAAYAASDRYELKAACDVKPEALDAIESLYPGIAVFDSHEAMFRECPTDVVSVSTFPPSHRAITMDALRLPLTGILVEKPLADTAAAGREIIRSVRDRKLPLVVPHSWLARDISQELKKITLGGEIGRIHLMEVQSAKWDIMNAGIHWVHFFLSCIPSEEPVELVMASCDSSTRTFRDGLQVETMGLTYVQMQSGTRLVMQTGDDTKVARGDALFRFYGEKGTLEWFLSEKFYTIRSERHPAGWTVEAPVLDPRRPHQRYIDSLAEQMDTGRFEYEIPELSLTALEICEAAYLSAERRCRVVFPFESFIPPPDTGWQPGKPYDGQGGGRDGRKL